MRKNPVLTRLRAGHVSVVPGITFGSPDIVEHAAYLGFDEYTEHANDEILLAVMVESEEAVANVREIMEVPGVDAIFVGPGDLMLDVRKNGHDAAVHEKLLQQVANTSKATGVAAGLPVSDRADAERRIAQGFRLISHGGDYSALMAGLTQTLDESRGWS